MNPMFGMETLLAVEIEFKSAERLEMALDDVGRDRLDFIGAPAWTAVLVDDRRANSFDEVVPRDAGERDAVILLEALFDARERGRRADIAQRHFERGRRSFVHRLQRGQRGVRR